MALKIVLKPKEKIVINQAVLVNGGYKTEFILQNKASVLREKDILTEALADTPAKCIYFTVQLIYMFPDNRASHFEQFNNFANQFVEAVPSSHKMLEHIYNKLYENDVYGALKECQKLIDYETSLFENAKQATTSHE